MCLCCRWITIVYSTCLRISLNISDTVARKIRSFHRLSCCNHLYKIRNVRETFWSAPYTIKQPVLHVHILLIVFLRYDYQKHMTSPCKLGRLPGGSGYLFYWRSGARKCEKSKLIWLKRAQRFSLSPISVLAKRLHKVISSFCKKSILSLSLPGMISDSLEA